MISWGKLMKRSCREERVCHAVMAPRESGTKTTSPRIAPPKLWDSSKPPGGKPKPAPKT